MVKSGQNVCKNRPTFGRNLANFEKSYWLFLQALTNCCENLRGNTRTFINFCPVQLALQLAEGAAATSRTRTTRRLTTYRGGTPPSFLARLRGRNRQVRCKTVCIFSKWTNCKSTMIRYCLCLQLSILIKVTCTQRYKRTKRKQSNINDRRGHILRADDKKQDGVVVRQVRDRERAGIRAANLQWMM